MVAGALVLGAAIGVPIGLLTRGSPAGGGTASNGGTAATQARTLYREALATMTSATGFHYVAVSSGGTTSETVVGDAGKDTGRQVITIGTPAGSEQFTLILVSGIVYFQGNALALEDQLGVPASGAPALVSRWISVSQQDGPYAVAAPGIVAADQAQETELVPASTTAITGPGGVQATRIVGTVPGQQGGPSGSGHLDVTTDGHVPLSYVATISLSGVSETSTTTFSAWGKAPTETAPSGAVAWSTLGASEPPGGYGSGGSGAAPSPTP